MASFANDLHSLPSVAGIVLTAMVLRDEEIKDLGFESFVEVMGPKIKGDFLSCRPVIFILEEALKEEN